MRIEFDPTNPTEAAAVRAMLTATAPAPEGAVIGRTISVNNGPAVTVFPQQHNPVKLHDEDGGVTINLDTTRITITDEITDPNGQVRDSNNEPHDPRIHSTPPKLNADGTWRAKRGVTADQIAAVRAEREAQATVTDGAGMAVTETLETGERTVSVEAEQFVVTAPPAPPVTTAPPAPTGQSEAPAETAPTPPSAPVVPSSPSFLDVMKAITAAQKDGKIDTAKVKELCAAVGAGESTMGLNGPDNGDKRIAFMALLASEVAA